MNMALILSGGMGARFGGGRAKQYQQLAGKEIIAYTVDTLKNSVQIDTIIVTAANDYLTEITDKYGIQAILGGSTRNESLKNGLEYIYKEFPHCDKVFINEAARPLITTALVDEYIRLLDEYDAVITTQPITDSLGKEGEAITDRSEYYLIQAPEAFRFRLLYEHFKAESKITATVQQLPPQRKVYKFADFRNNIKITYPEDMFLAEQLMRYLQ